MKETSGDMFRYITVMLRRQIAKQFGIKLFGLCMGAVSMVTFFGYATLQALAFSALTLVIYDLVRLAVEYVKAEAVIRKHTVGPEDLAKMVDQQKAKTDNEDKKDG